MHRADYIQKSNLPLKNCIFSNLFHKYVLIFHLHWEMTHTNYLYSLGLFTLFLSHSIILKLKFQQHGSQSFKLHHAYIHNLCESSTYKQQLVSVKMMKNPIFFITRVVHDYRQYFLIVLPRVISFIKFYLLKS